MSEKQEKKGFSWPGVDACMETVQQFTQPWSEVMQTSWNQVRKLQENLMARTQEAMQQSYDLGMEGFKQTTQAVQKFQELAQEQLKRFTNPK